MKAHLFLGHDGCVVVQRVAQHVATHALARLVVEILKERREVLQLQHGQDVVVGVHRNLQQSGELLGHGAAGCYAAVMKENTHRQLKIKTGRVIIAPRCIVSLLHIRFEMSSLLRTHKSEIEMCVFASRQ